MNDPRQGGFISDRPIGAPPAGAATETGGARACAAGGLIGALAASSCCILPVVLFSLGIGGTWIAHFTRLAPYKPAFLAVTASFLAAGYWLDRRAAKRACTGQTCAHPLSRWIVKGTLVAATAIAVAAAGFDYVAPYLLS